MAQEIDNAFARLTALEAELRAELKVPLNEADTRFRILDRMLVEVLGWDHASIHTEPPTPAGYIDYLVRADDGRSSLVIEAKRKGRLIPASNAKGVASLALNGQVLRPLDEAIRQAFRYATDEGIPYAATTDGNVWLFFRASRTDGKKPLEGKGILFRDFDTIVSNFPLFYELLAPLAVAERRNMLHLAKAEGLSVADAELHFFVSDPSAAKMHPAQALATDATLLFNQFFDKMSDESNDEMLTTCFVVSAESGKADAELEKITESLVNTIKSIDTEEGAALQQEVRRAVTTMQSETVLIVGNKGSGKSTFLRRFFRKILAPNLRSQCAVVRVDLEGYHGVKEEVAKWVIKELRKGLEKAVMSSTPPTFDELRGVFFEEYLRWRDGTHKHQFEDNKVQFLTDFGKHIEYLRQSEPDIYVKQLINRSVFANKRLPCLIFDNTDQFDLSIQDQVYQLAHSLGVDHPVLNIVPITDRTIWRLGKAGALQSYNATVFYLPVPDAKEIIAKRVNFVKSKLEGEPQAAQKYFSAKGFQIGTDDLSIIAEAIEGVLVQQDYVSGLIGRLGNFDIRRMLRIAKRIFVSPEIRIDDIVKSHFSGRPITADRYRTYRALMKGEYDRFSDEENEYVTNLFVTDPQSPTSPLLFFYILWLLRAKSTAARASEKTEGRHWAATEICYYLEVCGIASDSTMKALEKMLSRGLVEEYDPNTIKLNVHSQIAIKEAGIAHLDLVINSPVYMEQTALATGVNDRAVRDKMRELLRARNSTAFTNVKDVFVGYILKDDATRITIPSHPDFRLMQEARNAVKGVKLSHTSHAGFTK